MNRSDSIETKIVIISYTNITSYFIDKTAIIAFVTSLSLQKRYRRDPLLAASNDVAAMSSEAAGSGGTGEAPLEAATPGPAAHFDPESLTEALSIARQCAELKKQKEVEMVEIQFKYSCQFS